MTDTVSDCSLSGEVVVVVVMTRRSLAKGGYHELTRPLGPCSDCRKQRMVRAESRQRYTPLAVAGMVSVYAEG